MNETELLFTSILNCNRLSLYLNKDILLDKAKSSLVSSVLKRRVQGEPLQYILGKTEFMGLEFKVTTDVFIPRPETEILVETVIKQLSAISYKLSAINILDLGTGSGCIAVSLAKLLPDVNVTAIDTSQEALNIAKKNAEINAVADKIKFIQSDLLTAYSLQLTAYDIIVTNPPYIPTRDIETLQAEIRYEPRIALDGGRDGLDFYRRIIDIAVRYLKKGGFVIMEMGFNQKDAIKNIFQNSGYFEIIEFVKDYNNMDRVVIAKKRERKWIN